MLLVRPDGQGPGFDGARDIAGSTVDATIEVVLVWSEGVPVVDYPWQDLWLAPIGAPCINCASSSSYYGFAVDHDTDSNGDLVVDLSDVGFFTADLFGAYHFRSDLAYDGVTNVSDAGEMTAAMGVRCP